jgi:hypothetical protein
MRKLHIRRGIAAIALGAALVPVMAGSANAVSPLPIVCTAAGTVTFVNGSPDAWTVAGRGSCQGDLEGTYFLDFSGTGTSGSLGLCDQGLVVTDLAISVVGSLTNAQTLVPKFFAHTWSAPVTTYPLVTPFLVSQTGSGDLIGAGAFFNHIFLMCTGPSVAQFDFAFLT